MIAVQSGVGLGQGPELDDLPTRDADGELDVDLAELSLGERLTALTGREEHTGGSLDSDEDTSARQKAGSSQRKKKAQELEVPASSLTRTLIQALHSSDARLLETCLKHSDNTLIRNTVRRLPPQLAESLINACVERLGRGARAANMKGRGGGASSQRGTALIAWVRTVLAVHSGHLMTVCTLPCLLPGSGLY
jgi:U3 small nucleolar RNA-associated protein 5